MTVNALSQPPTDQIPSATSSSAFFRDTALMLLTRGGNILLGFASGILIARVLGPSGKGIITIALLIPTFMQSFGPLGLNNSTIYLLGRYPTKIRCITGNSVYASVAAFISCFTLFWLSYPFTRDRLFPAIPPLILLLATLTGGAVLIWVFGSALLLGQRRYKPFNSLQLLHSGSSLLMLVLLLWWFRMGVYGAIIAIVAAGTLVGSASLAIVLRGQHLPLPFNFSLLCEALKYGFGNFIISTALILLLRADMFLVGSLRSPAEVGLYSVAVALAEVLRNFPEVLCFALFPRIASLDTAAGKELTLRVTRISIFVSILILCFFFPLCAYLIRWAFGTAFLATLVPCRILAVSMLSLVISYNMASFFLGTGRVWTSAAATLTGLLVMLLLDLVWIPSNGIVGASWASLFGYSAMAAIQIFSFVHITGTRLSHLLVIRRSDLDVFCNYLRGWYYGRRGGSEA